MNKKKFIIIALVVVLVVALLIVIFNVNKVRPNDYTYNHSAATIASLESGEYAVYLKETGKDIVKPQIDDIVIKGYDYSSINQAATKRYSLNNKTFEENESGEYLLVGDTGSITYTVNVPEEGFYNLKLSYITTKMESKSSSIEKKMVIINDPSNYEAFLDIVDSEFSAFIRSDAFINADNNKKIELLADLIVNCAFESGKHADVKEKVEAIPGLEAAIKDYQARIKKYDEATEEDPYVDEYTKEELQQKILDAEAAIKDAKDALQGIQAEAKAVAEYEMPNISFQANMAKQSYVFSRVWTGDTGTIDAYNNKYDTKAYKLNLMKDTSGNDVKPSQIEVECVHMDKYFSDEMGYVTEPFAYYFSKGENTITLQSVKEYILLDSISLVSVKKYLTYAEYKAQKDLLPNNAKDKYSYRVEAEACNATSSPTLYPVTDRTSSATYPYSSKYTYLNSIGGSNWKVLGDWIEWEFEVENDGYYNISLRARQNLVRGMYSHRMVYIDDEIPFEELKTTVFSYSNDWQNITLGSSDGPFDFYLTKGKHKIRMEVTLGIYGELVEELESVTQDLSQLYLNIIKYTTVSPDTNRDYGLTKIADLDLINRLKDAHDRLQKLSFAIARIASKNYDKEDTVGDGKIYKDGKSDKTGIIDTMTQQIASFLEKTNKVTKQLSSFSTNISSLGTLLSDLREFPLTVDYLVIYARDGGYKLQRPTESGVKKFFDSIARFYYSFIVDYSEIGTTSGESGDGLEDVEIQVWMTQGRDQANVIRKLIDNDFSKRIFTINGKQVHIKVQLKLTGGDVLLKAALAGVGPEVAINVDSSLPVNYGLRHAALDLSTTFGDDYWNFVKKYFLSSTIRQFTFNGSTYAVPEKQIYMMMFVRTDVMENLYGINWEDAVPKNWGQVLSIMTDLQTNSLQFYLPVNDAGASALNPAFVTMLYQRGGQLYASDAKSTGLLEDTAMDAFEYWTDFYTKYSFPKFASFINRFRSGEMPLGISYYEMYNTLAVFAPEIRGNWAFYPLPGTEEVITSADKDPYKLQDTYPYTISNHVSVASGSGAIMIEKNAERDADKKFASWEFLKWWTGEVQDEFGKEMEGILGSSARHPTANFESFQQLAWPKADLDQLLKQWGIPKGTDQILKVKVKDTGNEYLDYTQYIYEYEDGIYHLYGVQEIPQIAGSYITGREVENAYRSVINNKYNAKETLYRYAQNINNEIDRKRKEFNLD